MLPARLTRYFYCLFIAGVLLFCPASGHSDVIYLKNGNKIEGRITRDVEGEPLSISTGASEILVPRDTIERVERGVAADLVSQEITRLIGQAKTQISQGNKDEARRILEAAQLKLENETEELEEVPDALRELREELEKLRISVLPMDPDSLKAEELFQEALRLIDHIQYRDAYEVLKKAAELRPERADIQFHLAENAREAGAVEDAIKAYGATLRLDPRTYYAEIRMPYMALLRRHGQAQLRDRRGEEAVKTFREILLLQDDKFDGDVAPLETFMRRMEKAESTNEEDLIMEVYSYADDRDLVDLAFGALARISEIKPDDKEVASLRDKFSFMSELKQKVDGGDLEGATQLLSETDESIRESEEVKQRFESLTGNLHDDLDARRLLKESEDAYEAGDYVLAAKLAEQLIDKYPNSELADAASEQLQEARFETPVKDKLQKIDTALKEGKLEEAQGILDEILAIEGIDQSSQHDQIVALERSLPREIEAGSAYSEAETLIDNQQFEEGIAAMEAVSTIYQDTAAGKRATDWLAKHRKTTARRAMTAQLVETSSSASSTDPAFWRKGANQRRNGQATAVEPQLRGAAWSIFDDLLTTESSLFHSPRSVWLYVMLPLVIGAALVFALFWKYARPGKGDWISPNEVDPHSDPLTGNSAEFDAAHKMSICRMCGLDTPPGSMECPHCQSPTKLSEIEQQRQTSDSRAADFDPWAIRVKTQEVNEFQKYYELAAEQFRKSDLAEAEISCVRALREDPHSINGYHLLADIYEKQNRRDEAAKCYREILLIEPTDVVTRQKVESVLSLVNASIDMRQLLGILAGCLWWLVFWLVMGTDPGFWLLRIPLCIAGGVLTYILWQRMQENNKITVVSDNRSEPDVHHPLPTHPLTLGGQNKQAQAIANAIRDHTNIEVPTLSIYRPILAVTLSALLLLAMVTIGYFNGTMYILLGWPAGVVLFFYILEFHPRLITAHVLLRHVFEETASAWMDPHRPFKPGKQEYAGEFLIHSPRELPFRWVFHPYPYAANRQGLLNSLQQTLNRHWAFHRFYNRLHIVRDVEIPFPLRFRRVIAALMVLVILGLGTAITAGAMRAWNGSKYTNAVTDGYEQMLAGDLIAAREHFTEALLIYPDRPIPHLYLAYVYNAIGADAAAERAFQAAVAKGPYLAIAYNDYGNYLQRQGRLRDAITQYQIALQKEPANPDILNNIGSAFYKLREYDKAERYLSQATTRDKKHPSAFTTLGLVHEAQGNKETAMEMFRKAVDASPNHPYTAVARDRLSDEEPAVDVAGGEEAAAAGGV